MLLRYAGRTITTGREARLDDPHQPPGDFGRDVFVFDTVGVGTTQLGATATRPFSGETSTYTLDVVVR